MSLEAGDMNGGDEDRVLVGEYVLGLLPPEEHAALARRIAAEPTLQAELRFWQSRLSGLDAQFAETTAPPQVWARLERRLFAAAEGRAPSWWESLAIWRGAAALAAAIAVIAIGINVMQPRAPTPSVAPSVAPQMVATLQTQADSGVAFVALYDAAKGTVRLRATSGQPVDNRDYELWYIPAGQPPVSMGVVPVDKPIDVPLTAAARSAIAEGTVLAVTLEPKGGSPSGNPTGPVVAAGPATTV